MGTVDGDGEAPGNLIHIGYPKAASNLLRSWFAKHPQLQYTEGGIGGFGDVHAIARHGTADASHIRWHVTSPRASRRRTPTPG